MSEKGGLNSMFFSGTLKKGDLNSTFFPRALKVGSKPQSSPSNFTNAHLHLHCPSTRARVRVRVPDRFLFTLHPRLGSEAMAILVACSNDHMNRRLWAWALHNLGRLRPRKLLQVVTRQKSQETDSDQCKHKTSSHLFWLCPRSCSDAPTEISDVV